MVLASVTVTSHAVVHLTAFLQKVGRAEYLLYLPYPALHHLEVFDVLAVGPPGFPFVSEFLVPPLHLGQQGLQVSKNLSKSIPDIFQSLHSS